MSGQNESIRIVILSGQNVHDWKATTPFLEKLYGEQATFKVVESWRREQDHAATFERCDVIVSNWTCHPQMTGGPWTEEGKKAFAEAIKSGKGMVQFHAASTACNDWEDFQEISGLTWKWEHTNHTQYHTFKVLIRDRNHPITKDMPDFWITTSCISRWSRWARLTTTSWPAPGRSSSSAASRRRSPCLSPRNSAVAAASTACLATTFAP
jgi:type 1 glutamine amidotransferase